MKLSKQERWILSNQYRILEKLDAENAGYYAEVREAIESGYERHYGWATQYIYDDVVSDKEADEIIDVLDMFDTLRRNGAADALPGEEWKVQFAGFDGNNETKQMAYASYFCKADGGRFGSLAIKDFNSHAPSIDRYRRQLRAWKDSGERHQLSAEDIRRIADEAVHPDRRT